jgi:hypothetical protein
MKNRNFRTLTRLSGLSFEEIKRKDSRHICIICGQKRYAHLLEKFVMSSIRDHYVCKSYSKGCSKQASKIFTIVGGLQDDEIRILRKILI